MLSHFINNIKNPIATKLLFITVVCGLLLAFFGIALQMSLNIRSENLNIEKRIHQIKISSLPSIAKSLWSFDEEQLTVQIEGILQAEDVIQVAISWDDWNNTRRTLKRPVLLANNDGSLVTNNRDFNFPLEYQDADSGLKRLGNIKITTTLTGFYQRLLQQAAFTALLQSLDVILLTTIVLLAIHHLLIRHISLITNYTSNLNLDDLGKPLVLANKAKRASPDEIDHVVDSINKMRVTLLNDIDQRHRIESDLLIQKDANLESQREAQFAAAANQAKSQFLATMSHEIRTPMNGVIGMVELLQDTALSDTQNHYLDIISRSGETLLEIINDILDYSKIEAGKMTLEHTSFNLEELVEDCIQLFGACASKNNLDLVGSVSPTTPILLKGDPTRLRQILINLLGNAFKFTRQGYVALEARREKDSPMNQPVIRFSVKDTGIGIDEQALPHLFDSFNQADNSTTRKYGGTGLGLAICHRLAELMGGVMGAESIKKEGSTFWFTAQFELCDEIADSPTHHINISTALTAKKLLIVEDNDYFCEVMYKHSLSWGMNTLTSTTGAAVLEILLKANQDNDPFDFIALDLILPDTHGLILAEQIRAIESLANIALFIVTASDQAISSEQMAALNIQKVIRKPFTPATLKLSLAQSLGKTPFIDLDSALGKDDLKLDANLRVLAAEDNAVNRMVIKGLLGKFGVVPEFAVNGKDAFNLACNPENKFDIIFMDCDMPIMDGFEAARRIRHFETTHQISHTHIIALTAHALQEHRDLVNKAGMDDYLAKPVSIGDLKKSFQRAGLLDFTAS